MRGYADDPAKVERPDEMSKAWKLAHADRLKDRPRDTYLAKECPVLMSIAAMVPGTKDRVRLMRLKAGDGELARHADVTLKSAGVADGKIARLHVPLTTNPEVVFTQWDHRGRIFEKHFPVGCLFCLDQRKPHRAVNGGASERTHLVIAVESGPELRSWIAGEGCDRA